MGSTGNLSKRTTVSSGGESWGMGFLLVFFPQQQQGHDSFKSPTLFKRSNSSQILAKAQSTISVCALVIFFTLLLFTLSTFEPNNASHYSHHYRRHLSQSNPNFTKKTLISPALQRLGTLYSRGTKNMNDLVLCHVPESSTVTDLKSFLRAFHFSGLLSKSDLLFLFPSITTPEFSDDVIREQNRLFLKLIRRYRSELRNGSHLSDFQASFDVGQFVKSGKDSYGEPVWGRRTKTGVNLNNSDEGTELTRLNYGSVVGFGVGELDPENSLSGFLEHVPMVLRRWASYPMLLGRLRRNYKHVMLVDVKEVVLLGDPLARVRTGNPELVYLYSTKHNRKPGVNPAVIIGGARGVRRLSAAMLTEIVRTITHRKKTQVISESALLSQLAASGLVQKNIHMVVSTESIPETSSLSGVGIATSKKVVRRGNSNIDIELMKRVCSFTIEASVYTECGKYKLYSV